MLSGTGMKTLLPLIAVAATATACGGPDVRTQDLRSIPGLKLRVSIQDPTDNSPRSQTEFVELGYDRATAESPCYRVPAATRLTVNGTTVSMRSRGDASLSFDGASGCERPWFAGAPSPMGEARVEYLLSDGDSRLRAVFQSLHVKRSIRVNGQEQATLHAGETVDVEWLPGTDQFTDAPGIDLSQVESGNNTVNPIKTYQLEGNHLRFTLPPMAAGQYRLRVGAEGKAGVEACEGFTSCDATFIEAPFVNVTVE